MSKVQEEAATLSMVMGEECWEGQPERRVPKQRKREIHIRCSSQKTMGATLSPEQGVTCGSSFRKGRIATTWREVWSGGKVGGPASIYISDTEGRERAEEKEEKGRGSQKSKEDERKAK